MRVEAVDPRGRAALVNDLNEEKKMGEKPFQKAMSAMGAELRKLREDRGLTQKEFASTASLTTRQIQHYEEGRVSNMRMIFGVASFHGVSEEEFLSLVAERMGHERTRAKIAGVG